MQNTGIYFINSFFFSKHFILISVMVDLELIPGTGHKVGIHTRWDTNPLQGTMYAYILGQFSVANLATNIFWEVVRNQKTPRKPTRT